MVVLVPALDAGRLSAVSTAVDLAFDLNAVADHMAIAVVALRRQCVNRALKAVKNVLSLLTVDRDFKRFFVFISTNFAACHDVRSLEF
jgi:hypothetical protein